MLWVSEVEGTCGVCEGMLERLGIRKVEVAQGPHRAQCWLISSEGGVGGEAAVDGGDAASPQVLVVNVPENRCLNVVAACGARDSALDHVFEVEAIWEGRLAKKNSDPSNAVREPRIEVPAPHVSQRRHDASKILLAAMDFLQCHQVRGAQKPVQVGRLAPHQALVPGNERPRIP